jgi:hypothetical protein
MPSQPTVLTGILKLRSNIDSKSLPKFGNTGGAIDGASFWISSGNAEELYSKTPYFSRGSLAGATANNLSYLYLNNRYQYSLYGGDPNLGDYAVASCFAPSFFVDFQSNEPKIGWNYTTSGSVNFASSPNSGNSSDRFEVFYLKYTTSSFLTAAGGGASANAITGITFAHEILPGNTTLSAQQIYYRKIGNISYPQPPEE